MILEEMHTRRLSKGKTGGTVYIYIVSECGADMVPDPHFLAVCHCDVFAAGTMLHQQQPTPAG
jgi:hypothetical protein